MVSMRAAGTAGLLAIASLLPAAALADAAGKSTLEETIIRGPGGGFVPLEKGKGEGYVVRSEIAKPKADRAKRRTSMLMFAQLTDPQVVDEMSPARIELVDPAGAPLTAAFRPQETLGPRAFDAVVRSINANRTSKVKPGKGSRGKVSFAISTGDLADNQQRNETGWVRTILDGGRVDPFSGKPISASNSCPGATPEQVAALNQKVAERRYTGVQNYDDYPGVTPESRYGGFWDPDVASPFRGGIYDAFPRVPGLLDAAQAPFKAAGLDVPWYAAFGNHDALVQGNAPASIELIQKFSVGCLKPFPTSGLDPASVKGQTESQIFKRLTDPSFLGTLLAGGKLVPPDPDRAFLSKAQFKQQLGAADKNHGFAYQSSKVRKATNGAMGYYAFTPRKGFRYIVLDTIAEGGGASGNLDDPQYRWLESELKSARKANSLVFVSSHHTLETMTNTTPDEEAGKCTATLTVGCDADPQKSTPIHRGTTGKNDVESLLLKYPNVIAYVNGHTHRNEVISHKKGKHGFFEINTSSHIDWPQQSRTIEVTDNLDGTLSIWGTIIDSVPAAVAVTVGVLAPGLAGPLVADLLAGSAAADVAGAAALTIAANDPQSEATTDGVDGRGQRQDRNVELIIPDPRR